MKKIFFLSLTLLFFIPEILADKRAPRGECYVSIGYVNDRAGVAEIAKNSFIKPENFELFEREDKKIYLTLGKIDENLFKKLQSQNKTYDFNCSRGKGYEVRLGLNSEYQIIGGNKINIVSAEQFISVVSSIETEKQRLVDLEVEKQVQARMAALEKERIAKEAAEKERQRLAELERKRKAEEEAEKERQRLAELERKRKVEEEAEKERLASVEEQKRLLEEIKKEKQKLLAIKSKENASPSNQSITRIFPAKYSCSNSSGSEDYTFNDEQKTVVIMTNFSDKPVIKEFKFLDENKELIEITYPEIAKKYPFMSSRTVLNRVTGKKESHSVEKLNNTVDCSIVAEETPEVKNILAKISALESKLTETRTKDGLLEYISSKKWQIVGLPCTLNGGTYQLFSSEFKVGWNSAAFGKLKKETANNASYTTKPIDGKTFRHEMTIYSGGNQMLTNALGSPNRIISYSMDEYILLDENTMQKTSIDNRQLNYDLMRNGFYQLENTAEIGKVYIVKACKD
jgi:flagellar biosynthesis GTPase FlhF